MDYKPTEAGAGSARVTCRSVFGGSRWDRIELSLKNLDPCAVDVGHAAQPAATPLADAPHHINFIYPEMKPDGKSCGW